MDLLGLLGRGHFAGADGPNRLVGDDHAGHLLGRQAGQRAVELLADDLGRCWPASRSASSSPTQTIGISPAARAAMRLFVHVGVGLAQDVPPLAVAENDVAAAQVDEHRGADLAGERAVGLVVHVLRAEATARAGQRTAGPRRDRRSAGRRPGRPRSTSCDRSANALASATAPARSRFIFQLPAIKRSSHALCILRGVRNRSCPTAAASSRICPASSCVLLGQAVPAGRRTWPLRDNCGLRCARRRPRRPRRPGHRPESSRAGRGVAGIDDDRQVRQCLAGRHRRHVEQIARGGVESLHAALAEHDVADCPATGCTRRSSADRRSWRSCPA